MGPDIPTDLPVQHLGLTSSALGSASGVPPLGEAIAPISGLPGDGVAVVTQVGGWSGGPGAVRWHGGQWVMPYTLAPRSVLQNVSCDVWNPTTTAPANVLVEAVSSNGQVLGSATAPASTSVTFRLWPFVGTHAVIDGEQLVVRLSPKDATTDAWTSAAQDMTVISCAVNASPPMAFGDGAVRTIAISPHAFVGLNATAMTLSQNATMQGGAALAAASVPVPVGATITGVRIAVTDSHSPITQVAISLSSTTVSGQEVDLATAPISTASGSSQVLTTATLAVPVVPSTGYWVAVKTVNGNGMVKISGAAVDYQ